MAEQPECTTWADGTKQWKLNGKLHREDGPAIEWSNGAKEWWLNGKRHRVDGPAVEFASGSKFWYSNGSGFSVQKYWAGQFKDKPVGTLIARSWGSCLKLSQTSFLLCDFAQKSLTLLDGA
jgi:hypothetical protein